MKKKGKTEKLIIAQKKPFSFPFWDKYFSIKEQYWLFVLVIGGTLLRVINAIYTPLWRDEIYIFFTARDNSLWKLITQQHWDTAHPPLHSIFLHFWQMISIQPFWLRLPSLIASFFILYLIPILAVKITQKYKAFPFVFLFLFSFSHTQISLNMVVRPYPFVILLMITSIILFFSIQERDRDVDVFLFIFTNWIMVFLDYSAFWLFAVYIFFFPFYCFSKSIKKILLSRIFFALILSAICSLTVFPFLLGNITNSLYLERFVSPIISKKESLTHGKDLYLYIERGTRKLTIYNEKLKLIKSIVTSKDLFPENKIYTGLDLSPLSLLSINGYSVCTIGATNRDIKNALPVCKYTHFLNPLKNNILYKKSPQILDFFLGAGMQVINTTINYWYTNLYKKTVNLKSTDNVIIKVNFSSNSLLYRSGINFFGITSKDLNYWWKDISRLTISAFEYQYRIVYYDGASSEPKSIFGDRGLLERFWDDLCFVTGYPYSQQTFILIVVMMCFVILSQFVLLQLAVRFKMKRIIFISFLFIVPVGLSLIISYYFVPIFVGRNVHMSNVSYLCGISFLISLLVSSENKSINFLVKLLGIVIILGYTILFLVRFPYIHYVDPPYDVSKIMSSINIKSSTTKKLIIIGNDDAYAPLLLYPLLLSGNNKVFITTQERIMSRIGNEACNLNTEAKRSIFFVWFEQLGGEGSYDFKEIAKTLRCNHLKRVEIPYIYFAKCE